jgi:chemotaxis protein CheX
MEFSDSELAEVTERVWNSILGLDLAMAENGAEENAPFFTGCVQITGEWDGAVTLICPETLARQATSIMFEMEPDEASFEEVQDAVGELTNMIGGNFKVLLPQPSHMSLPAVVEGQSYNFMIPGTQVVNEVDLASAGKILKVTILEKG